MAEESLKEKVALVTGASRGLGKAFAIALANAGMSVAITARSVGDLNQTLQSVQQQGMKALAIPGDITSRKMVCDLVETVEQQLGPIQLLVNNAGIGEPFGPTWETDAEQWWRCHEVNVRGPLLCAHAVLQGMVQRRRGRIINVASGAGTRPIPFMSAYVTSKAALIRFSEVLALEAQPYGISVFSIQPGSVRTAMAEQILSGGEGKQWFSWLEDVYTKGENVTPEPATRLVLYLASGEADHLSGRLFAVPEDPEEVVRRSEQVLSDDLYTLRMRKL